MSFRARTELEPSVGPLPERRCPSAVWYRDGRRTHAPGGPPPARAGDEHGGPIGGSRRRRRGVRLVRRAVGLSGSPRRVPPTANAGITQWWLSTPTTRSSRTGVGIGDGVRCHRGPPPSLHIHYASPPWLRQTERMRGASPLTSYIEVSLGSPHPLRTIQVRRLVVSGARGTRGMPQLAVGVRSANPTCAHELRPHPSARPSPRSPSCRGAATSLAPGGARRAVSLAAPAR